LVVALRLDGLNFDFESPLNASDPRNRYYATIIAETRAALRAEMPAASVSVDVGWSPDNVDGRYYDYAGLAAAADFLYVMDYDVRSQVIDRCLADANSPIGAATLGLTKYLQAGVPAKQLILGTPWYGYGYACLEGQGQGSASLANPTSPFCVVKSVPFRGVPCSDAAGGEISHGRQNHFHALFALYGAARTAPPEYTGARRMT
jgi:di-N-acetylchitobiase